MNRLRELMKSGFFVWIENRRKGIPNKTIGKCYIGKILTIWETNYR